ncbi:MAG: peptidoglycan DD-metalloendopeptidase family protein [Candidatus Aminicenantes bacterium]|nr:peptidoglycan DD-metalloendopeptidase family protein [Candidatus Aminicenantes bacterium]
MIKHCTILSFIGTALLVFSVPVLTQTQDLSEYEKRLAQINSQIRSLKQKIQEGEKKKSSIFSQLTQIGFQKKLLKNEIKLNQTKLRRANQELSSIQNKIPAIRKKMNKEEQSIKKILVTLYKYGKIDYLKLMLKVQNAADLLTENRQLTRLAKHQQQVLSGYLETLDELNHSLSLAKKKKEEINSLIQSSTQKNQELIAQERRHRSLLNKINSNRDSYQETIQELQERAEQLQNLMEKLVKNPRSISIDLVPMYEKKGMLPWPLSGSVTSSFGLQRHPKFNTITKNNGIEIAPGEDSVVKCIHPGIVVYTDYFQGYGNLIIIDHGMSYYSLYGHCSSFFVKKGDAVYTGQPIALVGDTSSLSGINLYLEIRYKTKPLNPLKWLK